MLHVGRTGVFRSNSLTSPLANIPMRDGRPVLGAAPGEGPAPILKRSNPMPQWTPPARSPFRRPRRPRPDDRMTQPSPKPLLGSDQSKAERVYNELRRRIRELALPPGAPLRKEEIALEMGVSRAPVSEAIAR